MKAEITLGERIAGALLGLHAGDCIGATREFGAPDPSRSHRDIIGGGPFNWAPGEPTDDTAQTAVVLRAYRDGYSLRRVADGLLDWFEAEPKDVGGATSEALRRYRRTRNPRLCGAGPRQRGNGSLMRCLPTALARTSPLLCVEEARAISVITHDDPVCREACATYVVLGAALVDGATPDDAIHWARAASQTAEVAAAVELGRGLVLRDLADRGDPGVPHGNKGYVLDSLALAVSALVDERSLEDVLIDIVSLGGDADSTGAIAGGLVGARDGVGAIPERWLSKLWLREEFGSAPTWLLPLREGSVR